MQLVRGVEFKGKKFPFRYTVLSRPREEDMFILSGEEIWMDPKEIPLHWRVALGEDVVKELYGHTS